MKSENLKKAIPTGLIFLFYLVLSLLVTYPLIFGIKTQLYGIPRGDIFSMIWYFWWQKYALAHGLTIGFCNMIAAPFGVSFINWPAFLQPALTYPALLLTTLSGEVFTYNALLIATFVIAAVTMYYLVYYFTRNRLASLVAGIIFSFSPYHLMHAKGHLNIIMGMQWLPLFVLSLFKLSESRSYKNMAFFAAAFSLVALSNFYDGFFAVVITGSFIVYKLSTVILSRRKLHLNLETLKVFVVTALLIMLLVIPFTFSTIKTAVEHNLLKPKSTETSIYSRSLEDLSIYSARPWEYFIPFIENPIFGKYTKPLLEARLHQSNVVEQTIFLGFIPLALALYALWDWFKKRRKPRAEKDGGSSVIPLLAWMAFVASVFSMPPVISRFGPKILMPSRFVYMALPMFRVYARFGVVVLLMVAALAGLGLARILDNLASRKKIYSYLSVALIILLIGLEFTNVPPFRVTGISKAPPVYRWLAEQPGDFIIAEYPLWRFDQGEHNEYLFYQRIHGKRLFNGADAGTRADQIRQEIEDISRPEAPGTLSYLKVKYVIVHYGSYPKAGRPRVNNSGLKPIKQIGDTVVYLVTARPIPILALPDTNFSFKELWADGKVWRWTGNDARLIILNNTGKKAYIDLKFTASSFARERDLRILIAKKVLKRIKISHKEKSRVEVKQILLRPGENKVILSARPDAIVIDSVLHNGDGRAVSIAYSDITVSLVK